jgi:soluble lytic murein transglycosylase-like protein
MVDTRGTITLSDRYLGPDAITYPASVTPRKEIDLSPPRNAPALASIEALIEIYALAFGIRPSLVRAIIRVESGFNTKAISPKGAMGLMQLMPETAMELGVRDPFDPEESIRAGVTYLKRLLTRFDQNEELALAAYNAGAEAVERHGMKVPPYPETRSYLKSVREVSQSLERSLLSLRGARPTIP